MFEENVVQPLLVNTRSLKLATECVCMILKIDDIVSFTLCMLSLPPSLHISCILLVNYSYSLFVYLFHCYTVRRLWLGKHMF
jgi:hypothetical protein